MIKKLKYFIELFLSNSVIVAFGVDVDAAATGSFDCLF